MTTETGAQTGGDRSARRGWLLGVLLAGPFMALGGCVTVVNVATPSIRVHLGASGAMLQLVIGGYLIALAMMLITGARLGQAFGYRRAFVAGVTLFSLASLACGLAPDPIVLADRPGAAGRGGPESCSRRRSPASSCTSPVPTGCGRSPGTRLHCLRERSAARSWAACSCRPTWRGWSWRPIFLINVPVGVLAVAAALRYLPVDTRASRSSIFARRGPAVGDRAAHRDPADAERGSAGWPAWAWVSLAASVPSCAAFIVAERLVTARGGVPLLDVRLLAIPVVRWSLAALTVASTGTYYDAAVHPWPSTCRPGSAAARCGPGSRWSRG